MKHPRRLLAGGAWPAVAENRLPLADDLGLNEEIAERRMNRVRSRHSEDDFSVACDVEDSGSPGAVGNLEPAQFDVIRRGNRNFRMSVDLLFVTAEFHPRLRKHRLITGRWRERRLICGGPELPARHVADVAKCPPIVAGAVFTPARDRQVFPSTVPAACVR